MVPIFLLGFIVLGGDHHVQTYLYNNNSVYNNFTIHYDYVASDEIVVLQNAIEEVGNITMMRIRKISMVSPDVMSVPSGVKAYPKSSTEIVVSWQKRFERIRNFTTKGYTVFCRLFPDGPWERFSTNFVMNHTIINRRAYTLYTIRVVAYHSGGNGLSSEYLDIKTLGGIPDKAPQGLSCFSETSTTITLNWNMLDDLDWNGFAQGYEVTYQVLTNDSTSNTVVVSSSDGSLILQDLKQFTVYKATIAAKTRRGKGPRSGCAVKTLEGVPSRAPVITQAALDPERPLEAFIEWDKIPPEYHEGDLRGYTVYYGVTRDGKINIEYPNEIEIKVDKWTTAITLKQLKIDTEIRIAIAGRTSVGVGERSKPEFFETCKCPKFVYAAWFHNPPYVRREGNIATGILPDYLGKMVNTLCGACHALGRLGAKVNATRLLWDRTKNGHSPIRTNQKRLKEQVGNSVHLHVAILGRSEIHNFQSIYKFVCIVHSPGIAFIVRDPLLELNKTKAIMNSLLQCWPAVIIIILFSMVFGIIMWLLDCRTNQEEFPNKNFIQGLYHGSYWAFVSMTTVGYGDKTPRSFCAQCVAITWMLMGPIINGIVISAVTTSLTTINMEGDPKIYGSKVGAIWDSFEYNLGVRRNAKMNATGVPFTKESDLIDALKDKTVDGVLIDSLVAASMAGNLSEKKLKISKIIPEKSGWGIVLSAELLALEEEIRTYEENYAEEMRSLVQNKTRGLKVKAAPPAELTTGLVDPNSPTFLNIVQYGTIAIGISVIIALIFEYGYLRYRKNRVVPLSEAHRRLLEDDVAKIVLDFCNDVPEKLKTKSDEHESELKRFFWKKGYSFGIDGWLRQKTSNEEKIKKDIRYQEIMNEDLGLYKKDSINGKVNPLFNAGAKRSDKETEAGATASKVV